MLGVGRLECVSYGIVRGMFYCVDSEKVLISEDNRRERELYVQLCRLVVETHPGRFLNVFPLIYARCSNYFMIFMLLFIERIIQ